MSFWKRTLMGGDKASNSSDLPSSSSSTGAGETTSPPRPPQPPASTATRSPPPSSPSAAKTIGPLPIGGTAYTHSSSPKSALSPSQRRHNKPPVSPTSRPPPPPPPIPKYHIFTPKPSTEQQLEEEEEKEEDHVDSSPPALTMTKDEQPPLNDKVESTSLNKSQEEEWDLEHDKQQQQQPPPPSEEKAASSLSENNNDDDNDDETTPPCYTEDSEFETTTTRSHYRKSAVRSQQSRLVQVSSVSTANEATTTPHDNDDDSVTTSDSSNHHLQDEDTGVLLPDEMHHDYGTTLTPIQTEIETAPTLRGNHDDDGTTTTTTPVLSPKFDFLNDEVVPLEKLQDSTLKRRHESHSRIHQLDCQLASLQAKLANETMDRSAAGRPSRLDSIVTQPLAAVAERTATTQLLSSTSTSTSTPSHQQPPDASLHCRLLALEARRTRHMYVDLPDALSGQIESPRSYVVQELQASVRLETTKADKRGGTMVRRFDSMAGVVARRHYEETASRRAALLQVQTLARDAADLNERRAVDVLHALEELRQSLRRERNERRTRDDKVMELIVERTAQLQRALLEAAGSG